MPIITATPNDFLIYCRPGFEREAALEIEEQAADAGAPGESFAQPQGGFVRFSIMEGFSGSVLSERVNWHNLVFARQLVHLFATAEDLSERDRVTPIVEAAHCAGTRFSQIILETADTNEAKTLSGFLKRFSAPLEKALGTAGLLGRSDHLPRLHIFFTDMQNAWLGTTQAGEASDWPMGIPRLRMPHDAPSRSTLKLSEAFHTLLSEEERTEHLRAGLRAVDLGASPGGWTWQLASRGLHVTALDNGPLAPSVMATGMVEHLKADGFTWRPKRNVEWLVCDMVEQPARISHLIGDWVATGRCRRAIFNLKLPMKKRYEELERCRELIAQRFRAAGKRFELRIKHLYHDREEVTCYLTVKN